MIALVGDTHLPRGSRRLPDSCVELLRAASHVVHTGDFTSLAAFEQVSGLGPPVTAGYGNMDEGALRELLPERAVVEADGLRIGVVHDPGPAKGRSARLQQWFPDCGLVVYGHTHAPEATLADGVWIVNPGSPTERRRASEHTMAVVVDGRPSLVAV